MTRSVKRVEYLSGTPIEILYSLILTLKTVSFDKEYTIFNMNSVIDSIDFVRLRAHLKPSKINV